jgi:NAD(P)-dependent dehydrogenase (short-subunit alcohol dehydrogenase family)
MALGLAAAGADIIVTSRNPTACESVVSQAEASGRRALALPFEAARWSDCDQLVHAAYQRFGRIDVLVNNAAASPPMPVLEETTEALFDEVMAINFRAPFRLATLIGSRMAKNDGGSIINIGSGAAFIPEPGVAVYGAAKAALVALTRALARAYAPKVRVNILSPGPFDTDIWNAHRDPVTGKAAFPDDQNALGRMGEPDELVSSVLYLASSASSYTTGGCLRVDGGLL